MMEIRKPTNAELEQILTLAPQALYEGTLGKATLTHENTKKLITALLEKGCYYLAAFENDQLTGWVLIGASQDRLTEKETGFIHELYVKPEFRGKGLSKQLMTRAIHQLKAEGYPEIRLNVFAGNPAIKLYEKMGFNIRNLTMSLSLN
jgi:ribosomal protein S18 acetylase RimI-like enzyme